MTGFKYIGNTALDLEKTGKYDVLFGYEEAIGFMFGPMIRDKDGVAAAVSTVSSLRLKSVTQRQVMFAQMVIELESRGQTAYSYLRKLYQR